jgi:hypothetical protein
MDWFYFCLPTFLRKSSEASRAGNFLSEFVPLPFNVRPPSWMYASRLIRETLRNSEHKVDIIELPGLRI